MALTALDNLVRIGQLKAEPRNNAEVQRMLAMAQTRWADAQLAHLSQEGRFSSAYNTHSCQRKKTYRREITTIWNTVDGRYTAAKILIRLKIIKGAGPFID